MVGFVGESGGERGSPGFDHTRTRARSASAGLDDASAMSAPRTSRARAVGQHAGELVEVGLDVGGEVAGVGDRPAAVDLGERIGDGVDP